MHLKLLIIILVFLVSGCTDNKQDTLKIGAILPLTGKVAFVGEPEKAALKIALQDIKDKYGDKLKIELIIEDSKADPKTAVTLARKLTEIDNVDVLFVSLSKINKAVSPTLIGKDIVHFATTTSDIGATSATPFTFRIYENFGIEMELLAKHAAQKGIEELISIKTDDYAIEQAYNELKARAELLGVKVSEGSLIQLGNKDYRTELQKIPRKLTNKQGLVFLGYGPEFPRALKTLKELDRGIGNKLGMYTFMTGAAQSEGVELLEGIEFSGFAKTQKDKKVFELTSKVMNTLPKYQASPFINFVYTYDAMMLLAEAANDTEDRNSAEELTSSILTKKRYVGVGGEININNDRDSIIPMAMFKYLNGQIVPL